MPEECVMYESGPIWLYMVEINRGAYFGEALLLNQECAANCDPLQMCLEAQNLSPFFRLLV